MKTIGGILLTVIISVITTLVVISTLSADDLSTTMRDGTGIRPQTAPITATGESVPDVVAAAAPAVVSVVITADVPVIERYYESVDPFGGFFGGFSVPRQRQIGTEEREIGGGTGFFVSSDGYLITNRHVVDLDNVEYSILTNDGESFPVAVIAKDPTLDIAVLKVTAEKSFPFLSFGDIESVRLGEPVIAIGNALAEFPNSVSVGVVSGLSRNIMAGNGRGLSEALEGVIQTDAAINQGNSGGPLLNAAGEVIGVNVAVAGGSENIGFALPGSMVAEVFRTVAETGEIVRPFLGVRFMQIDEQVAEVNNLSVDYGVIIIRGENRGELAVMPGSAADQAGLEENDIILEIGDVALDGSRSLPSVLREFSAGEVVDLLVLKDGEEITIPITLDRAPE